MHMESCHCLKTHTLRNFVKMGLGGENHLLADDFFFDESSDLAAQVDFFPSSALMDVCFIPTVLSIFFCFESEQELLKEQLSTVFFCKSRFLDVLIRGHTVSGVDTELLSQISLLFVSVISHPCVSPLHDLRSLSQELAWASEFSESHCAITPYPLSKSWSSFSEKSLWVVVSDWFTVVGACTTPSFFITSNTKGGNPKISLREGGQNSSCEEKFGTLCPAKMSAASLGSRNQRYFLAWSSNIWVWSGNWYFV